jgi:hypothetical protein
MHEIGRGYLIEESVGGHAIGNLAAGQQKRDGPTVLVGQRMDFGRAPAA